MDTLKNKTYVTFTELSRYASTPMYYDSVNGRSLFGIGSQMKKDVAYVAHKVRETDTLFTLALKYYNNPTLWWVIAYFNNIIDSFCNLFDNYTILKIPNLASVAFEGNR